MKKVNSTKDVPWFKIENYNYIYKLDNIDLLDELSRRRSLYSNRNTDLMEDEHFRCFWKGILNGQPNTHVLLEEQASVEREELANHLATLSGNELTRHQEDNHIFEDQLSYDDAVYPVGMLQFIKYSNFLNEKGIYKHDGEFSCFKDNSLYGSLSKTLNEDLVTCEIHLSSHTDEEIITSLRSHLPKWREEMEIAEPVKRFIKQAEVSKIKTYRIIPLLDLLIWEAQVNLTVPKRVQAALVFPFGEMGSEDLSGGNAKISSLLNTLLCKDLSLTNITGEFNL
ncbi:DUF6387 family protein [Pseudoalteromonas sp. NZS11_1]|mgnify:CR=1 FL=1|uniref:DUF6387 family protein n=1 Tax=Pseudoalteromonas sp. NZS11_1 TaxID=2792070 RepID=UPI0018CE0718|nr:DUF6387 family protein [Pseudoalteromonas sp. NZS11_1]MBH0045225.1 hypothetical protein [Pseudoalteromonas sp. NZS11_1]|tara:strand:+ start:665 stop:1510 length:846 start_codon:yes stop_codon:yes gene_type:complete